MPLLLPPHKKTNTLVAKPRNTKAKLMDGTNKAKLPSYKLSKEDCSRIAVLA